MVTRVASGSYTSATASIGNSSIAINGASPNASINTSAFTVADTGSGFAFTIVDTNNNYYYLAGASFGFDYNFYQSTLDYGYFSPTAGAGYTLNQWTSSLISLVNSTPEISSLFNVSSNGTSLIFSASAGTGGNGIKLYTGLYIGQATGSAVVKATLANGTTNALNAAFDLETITQGEVMNNNGSLSSTINGALPSGSSANIRWEVVGADTGSGVFSLIIRREMTTRIIKLS